jgi:5-methylcytosine-specific restriction protein A
MPLFVCANCFRTYPPPRGRGRCPECQRSYYRVKDKRRGSAGKRGYGAKWRKLRDHLLAAHPYCATCHHAGTKDNPLSVDHIVPKSEGGTDALSNLRVLCLRCNQQRNAGSKQRNRGPKQLPTDTDHDDVWSIA